MPIVDVTKVASFLNLTEARIQQLVKAGMPRESRGRYDPIKCAYFYIRYLQRALKQKAVPTLDGGYVGEREERVRLLRADADLREIELAKERGQLVAIEDVEHAMTDLVLITKARILAVGARVAPQLVGETSSLMIQAVIDKAHKEALSMLAKHDGPAAANRRTKSKAGVAA